MRSKLVCVALGLLLACTSETGDTGSGAAGSGGTTSTATAGGTMASSTAGGTAGTATGGSTSASGGTSGTGSSGASGSGIGGAGGAATGGSAGTGGRAAMDAGIDGRAEAGVKIDGGGPSLCTPGKYVICEDFEGTAAGAVPIGWTKHGGAAVVTDESARGTHSLKIDAAINGERRIYADASRLGSGHWGRIFYKVQAPPVLSCDTNPVLHSTIVAFQGVGPTQGAEEVRVVDTVENQQSKHQFLYNVQPNGAEFGKGSPYNWQFDGAWHCAEWHIDNPTQSYHFYIDGAEVTSIAIDNGPGNYAGTDIPPSFSQVRVGWNNYQKACAPGQVAWIDEVALDTQRIGCAN
jgi:hypothetical protein